MHVKDVVCIVFDPIGLLTTNHIIAYITMAGVYAETFDVNIKILQTMQNSWHFIVRKLSPLKKWQTLVIIQEISYSNWRTGEMVQNLESLWIILESWQLCESDICLLLHSTNNKPSNLFASIIFSSYLICLKCFLIMVLFKNGPPREILNSCQHCKLLWTSGEVFFLAKMPQCPFF